MAVATAVQICPQGKIVYGMQLPIAAQSTVFAAPWEAGAGTAEIRRIAQACDASGFFYLAVSDHVCVPREHAKAMSTVWYDTVATLGFLAAVTQHVRLLSYVYVAPYRHPLMTAKAFATLDALSGGRVILGVGAGHRPDRRRVHRRVPEPQWRDLGGARQGPAAAAGAAAAPADLGRRLHQAGAAPRRRTW
jgi:alkanesulfonate monooxygenase SsuD/methylene tetrahydromethanopterin reductase-like flavin-dependent oxidoreductase (luciferase family)